MKLTKEQMEIGAKYLAVTNMGMEHNLEGSKPYTPSQVESAFEQTANDFYAEVQEDAMEEEKNSWLKELQNGNKFSVDTVLQNIKF